MNKSDLRVFESLRNIHAVVSLPYYMQEVFRVEFGAESKEWLRDTDTIANWLIETLLDHPTYYSIQVLEMAMDAHVFEWADRITVLAKMYFSDKQEIQLNEALKFVFCPWFSRVILLSSEWMQQTVELGSFKDDELASVSQLGQTILCETPLDRKNWHSIEKLIDDYVEQWAKQSLLT